MDRPQQGDLMFCHECENEWYREEWGLACPDCRSEFTEVVEADNDPREDDTHTHENAPQEHPLHNHNPWDAPDPEDGDIDNIPGGWQSNGPGGFRTTFTRTYTNNPGEQQQGGPPGFMGILGPMLQGMMGGQQQQQQQQQAGQEMGSARAGSPNGSSTLHTRQGPGFSYSFTTNLRGPGLAPRNANGPQPFNPQPAGIDQLLQQMMMNIGAFPPPGGHVNMQHHGPNAGGPEPLENMGPFGGIFQLFNPGGVHGDAVYSQEALDRVITQLMEQHTNGHAPGPASEQAIDALPTRPIIAKDLGENGKADCSICMEEVNLGEKVTVLPCSHWFHGECVKAWLIEHDTCPQCRQGIMPKDAPAQQSANEPRSPSQTPLNQPQYGGPMPGMYPAFGGPSGSGSGTAQDPFNVPDSPRQSQRRLSARQDSSSGSGLLGRMRDAFGGGGSTGGGDR